MFNKFLRFGVWLVLSSVVTSVVVRDVIAAERPTASDLLSTEAQQAAYYEIIEQLRCPKCQNQSIADSDAPIAQDIQYRVAELLQEEGMTKQGVREHMMARYGDFISYRPPVRAGTAVLWFGPPLLLVVLVFFFWRRVGKTEQQVVQAASACAVHVDSVSEVEQPVNRWQKVLLLGFVLVLVLVGYLFSDRFAQVYHYELGQHGLAAQFDRARVNPEAVFAILTEVSERQRIDFLMGYQQALLKSPASAEAWQALARVYQRLGNAKAVYQASKKAYLAAPDRPDLAIAVIRADMALQSGKLSPYGLRLLALLQSQYPRDPRVLSFVGLTYYALGDLPQAQMILTDFLRFFPLSLEAEYAGVKPIIEKVIKEIQQSGKQKNHSEPHWLEVQIQLDDALIQMLTGDEQLFVFAKALQGPRFPLAVIKRTVAPFYADGRQWPMTVRLSSENQMLPGVDIHQHLPLMIGARLSKSGDAMPQTGDVIAEPVQIETLSGQTVRLHLRIE